MQVVTKLSQGGRVVIPAEYRKALGLKPGDHVVLSLEDGEVRVSPVDRWVRRAQDLVRRHVPKGVSLADEVIQERRQEAARE